MAEPKLPAGTQNVAGPPGGPSEAPTAPAPAPEAAAASPTAPEPAASPAAATSVTPGDPEPALTGDGTLREQSEAEQAYGDEEGGGFPDEDRLAEMVQQSRDSVPGGTVTAEEANVPEPEPVGVGHRVHDNVSGDEPIESWSEEPIVVDNVSEVPRVTDPADAPLDPSLSRGTLDPDG